MELLLSKVAVIELADCGEPLVAGVVLWAHDSHCYCSLGSYALASTVFFESYGFAVSNGGELLMLAHVDSVSLCDCLYLMSLFRHFSFWPSWLLQTIDFGFSKEELRLWLGLLS